MGKSFYVAPKRSGCRTSSVGSPFGAGMTLASGCGNKTAAAGWRRRSAGAGDAAGDGVFAWFTLRGILAVFPRRHLRCRRSHLCPPRRTSHHCWAQRVAAAAFAALVGAALLAFALAGREFRADKVELAGRAGHRPTVVAGWYVSGRVGFVAEHPETLERRGSAPAPGDRSR